MNAGRERPPERPARRTPEQRRHDRALGVDGFGRPLPRALGLSPRQVADREGVSMEAAKRLAWAHYAVVLERRGAGPQAPITEGLPATGPESPAGPQEPPQAA